MLNIPVNPNREIGQLDIFYSPPKFCQEADLFYYNWKKHCYRCY